MTKTEITGFAKKVITGMDYNDILRKLDKLTRDGWEIHKATSKRQFPFFWIKKYKVKLRRHFMFVDEEIVFYSKKAIESLNP